MLRLLKAVSKQKLVREDGVRKRVSGFARDTRGTAAIEFAFVAPPFFLLLFSMFEIGLTYSADAVLQSAVNDTARMIRTGQVQAAGLTPEQFRVKVCEKIDILLTCDERLKIDVRRFDSFTSANLPSPLQSNGEFGNDFRFQPGAPCDVVLVRAFYKWDTLTPGLGDVMKNMGDNGAGGSSSRLLQGAAAVRNEPFESAGPVC